MNANCLCLARHRSASVYQRTLGFPSLVSWGCLGLCWVEGTPCPGLGTGSGVVKILASSCCVASVSTSANSHLHSLQDKSKDATAKKSRSPTPLSLLSYYDDSFPMILFFPSSSHPHCLGANPRGSPVDLHGKIRLCSLGPWCEHGSRSPRVVTLTA